jgi:hypothetical protein
VSYILIQFVNIYFCFLYEISHFVTNLHLLGVSLYETCIYFDDLLCRTNFDLP